LTPFNRNFPLPLWPLLAVYAQGKHAEAEQLTVLKAPYY